MNFANQIPYPRIYKI